MRKDKMLVKDFIEILKQLDQDARVVCEGCLGGYYDMPNEIEKVDLILDFYTKIKPDDLYAPHEEPSNIAWMYLTEIDNKLLNDDTLSDEDINEIFEKNKKRVPKPNCKAYLLK